MGELFLNNPWIFSYILLPFLIFIARVSDVTIDTLRLMFVARGDRKIAPILGFFSILIWIIAIAQIMQHLDNVLCYIAYAGGYATGNYIGITLEERLSVGTVLIRVFPRKNIEAMTLDLRTSGFGITLVDTEGATGKSKMLLSSLKRKDINRFISIVKTYSPKSFYTIESIRTVSDGIFNNDKGTSILKIIFGKVKK